MEDLAKNISIPNKEENAPVQINSPTDPKADTNPMSSSTSVVKNTPSVKETEPPSNVSLGTNAYETEKKWHYQDPKGKMHGPFSLKKLRKWKQNNYFPASMKVWKTSESQENSVLLTDALDGKLSNEPQPACNNSSTNNAAALVDSGVANSLASSFFNRAV